MANILVIDDDKVVLNLARAYLVKAGYSVVTATEGYDALDKLKREAFDVIISDINMSTASGFELIKTIRGDTRYATIPVMFLTGRKDKRDVQKAIECGADDYLVKPLDGPLLISKVEELIHSKVSTPFATYCLPRSQLASNNQVGFKVEITTISEQGVSFVSPAKFSQDANVKLDGELLRELGIEHALIRTSQSEVSETQPTLFQSSGTFVGLHESERQRIRSWVSQRLISDKE